MAATDGVSRVLVLPGDNLTESVEKAGVSNVTLGPGLRQDGEKIISTKAGVLKFNKNTCWIDCHQKRYVPAKGDKVLGVVTQKDGASYKVDIGGSLPAILSYLAFEGATKKNRPNVQVGDVLYAKLLAANRSMDPELVCIDSTGKSHGLGVVGTDGFMFHCTHGLVRRLLSKDCLVLQLLGERIKFEIAFGMNGRIWVRTPSVKTTIALVNALLNCEHMTTDQMRIMVRRLINALDGF